MNEFVAAAWEPVRAWGAERGFERMTARKMVRTVSRDWTASVRLDQGRQQGEVMLAFSLTTEYLPLIEWWAVHLSERKKDGLARTFHTDVMDLLDAPARPGFRIVPTPAQAEVFGRQVADALGGGAQDWIAQHSDTDACLQAVSQKGLTKAIISGLLGDPDRAVTYLEPELDRLAGLPPDGSGDFLRDQLQVVIDEFRLDVSVPLSAGLPIHESVTIPIVASAEGIQTDLYHYGEDDLAERARTLSPDQHQQICLAAGRIAFSPDGPRLLSMAIALAAVEVLEGRRRPLHRKRRRNLQDRPPWMDGRP